MQNISKRKTIDGEIQHIVEELSLQSPDSDEYSKSVCNLEVLCKARSYKTDRSVSTDTIVLAITNIIGILLVLNYEQLHVIGSKSLGLILKTKV
jgi:hypothetical protein